MCKGQTVHKECVWHCFLTNPTHIADVDNFILTQPSVVLPKPTLICVHTSSGNKLFLPFITTHAPVTSDEL